MKTASIAKTLLSVAFAAATVTFVQAQPKESAIVAHRGYWNCKEGGYARNSLAALESAQKAGFWGSEFDVNMTSDGELLIFHDAHIDGKRIDQTPYAEFKDYRLENGEPIPTLDQYLAQAKKYPKTVLVFEMKWHSTDEIENRAIALSIEKLKKYKLLSAPGFTVQYLGSDRRPAQAAEMGMNGVDTWFKTLLDDATWYPEARKLGMSINTWTVNDPAQMETLFKMGVDQLTTDNPMQAREVLEKIGMREVVAGKKVKIKK